MRSISEIRRDMEYPSPEVKTRCMNEVARYLRDAYECGVYSKALDKLSGCDYYFRIDPDELMELLTNRYDCGELCEKAVQLRESYAAKIDLPVEKIDKIDAGFIHKFVCEQVTGRILDLENINCQYIDDFVQGIEELKIPGILYPLIWFTRNRDKKVFLYIYEKYVLPAYINLSESNAIDRYDALGEVLCGYIEELIIYVVGTGDGVYVTSIQKNSTWDDVMIKFKKTGEFDCIRRAREKLKFSNGIGTLLYALNKKYKHWLKSKYKTYRSDFYPMFAALIAFALLGEKRDREAVEFMIDNYADISEDNYQSDYSLIILFQTILLADNYEYMNILYAYLLKEKLSYKRAYTEIYDLIIKACDFIEELYDELRQPKDDKFSEMRRHYLKDTVFEEWGTLLQVRSIKDRYKYAENQEKARMFNRLMNIIYAFADSEGVRVKALGHVFGRNYSDSEFIKLINDDKVFMGISPANTERAAMFYKRFARLRKPAESIRNYSFFQRVDIIIKEILIEKMEKDIENTLLSISQLRQKQNYADREDEFIALVEPAIASLTNRISAKYIDRNSIIDYFRELDGDVGCWEKLDDDCRSMLITSEIVYRTLVARQDAETLDYSASMIPLTKVIEYLLNGIYGRIKHNIIFDGPGTNIDPRAVDYFRDKSTGKPKKGLEMGPAIKMLSDGYLRFEGEKLVFSGSYMGKGRSRFNMWRGNEHVDWNLLRDFSGISLDCNSFEGEFPVVKLTIGNNADENRKIFIGALEYIKNYYRNKVAHKDGIKRPRMEKCREDMLTAQKLIWMLVHIIK